MSSTKWGKGSAKRVHLLLVLLLVLSLVAGCAPVDVRRQDDTAVPSPTATESKTSGADSPATSVAPVQQVPGTAETPAETSTAVPFTVSVAPVEGIERVDIYYDATLPMLGFADIPGRDAGAMSAYLKLLDVLPSALTDVFARAAYRHYRVDTPSPAAPLAEMQPTTLMSPSFYLTEDMQKQPPVVKLLDEDGKSEGQRMNEFMIGYYAANGLLPPGDTSMNESPSRWALTNASTQEDEHILSVVVTDLSELRRGIEPLRAVIVERIMDAGFTLGILGIHSDFAGFTPLFVGEQDVWMEWGSRPTGSIERTLVYEADLSRTRVSTRYRLPMSIDPAKREAATRPVYLLCFGASDAVNACLRAVDRRLSEGGVEGVQWRAYDAGYLPAGHTLDGRVTTVTPDGDNARMITKAAVPEGMVDSLQLFTFDGSKDKERFVEFLVTYQPSIDDPRIGRFTKADFGITIHHTPLDDAQPALQVDAKVIDVGNDPVTGECVLRVRVDYPIGGSGSGEYDAQVQLTLKAYFMPGGNQSDGFGAFINASDSIQDIAGFDGGQTLGMGRLLESLDAVRLSRAKDEDMGMFVYRVRAEGKFDK